LFHFLFGAAAGSVYGMLEEKVPLGEVLKGSLAGLVVWAVSYLGWIPAFGILPPATEHPWRRNVMMITAHLIWGMVLGVLAGITNSKRIYIKIQ
jgi:putative membrane protein